MPAPDTATVTELWHRLGMCIRLGLETEDTRLIARYLHCNHALCSEHGRDAWDVTVRSLRLLLDTAHDGALPIVWRLSCLDACFVPLQQLGPQASTPAQLTQLRALATRFSCFDCCLRRRPDTSRP